MRSLHNGVITLFLIFALLSHADAQYCTPASSCATTNNITRVILGTLSNGSACSQGGYMDYSSTTTPPNVNAGVFTPLQVWVNATLAGDVAVWIDYDHSGSFDANEYKFVTANAGMLSTSLFVPSTATGGLTRMRIRKIFNGMLTPTDACLAFSSGETEDYTINIIPASIAFYFTPFTDTLYSPVLNISARITQKDIGLNTSETLKPRIYARRQTSSVWKSFPGQLISGNGNDGNWKFPISHDSLGISQNTCDSILYYFVAQDLNTPISLGYLPEAVGTLHTNVAESITRPSVPFGYRLKQHLSGTLYIGWGGCRYNTFSGERGLFQEINKRGLEADVTVLVEDNLIENGKYKLDGTRLNGYRLLIRPVSATQFMIDADPENWYGAYRGILRFSNARNVTIDGSYNGSGRYLLFRNLLETTSASDTISSVQIENSCDSIILRNVVFRSLTSVHDGEENCIRIAQGKNRNIFILDNIFDYLMPGYYLPERFIASKKGDNQAIVKRNEFRNFSGEAIRVFDTCSNWIIDSNHFYRNLAPPTYTYHWSGIFTRGSGHVITNNYIGGSAPYCSGSPLLFSNNRGGFIAAIRCEDSSSVNTPTIIAGNRIDNMASTSAFTDKTGYFYGIAGNNNYSIITNNTIGNPQSTNTTIDMLADFQSGISSTGIKPAIITGNTITSFNNENSTGPYFSNALSYGIIRKNSVGFIEATDSSVITDNHIYNIGIRNAGNGGFSGIYVAGGTTNRVERNRIHDVICKEGAIVGITYLQETGGVLTTIANNRIYNFINININSASCCEAEPYRPGITGIVTQTNARLDIINNQLSFNNNNITSPAALRGIYCSYAPATLNQRIIYNSIYLGGTASLNGNSAAIFSSGKWAGEIYNNIFYNSRRGGAPGNLIYRFGTSAIDYTGTRMNHNLYVINDSSTITKWLFAPVMGWTSWKNNTHFDDTSFVFHPMAISSNRLFLNTDSGDLNINNLNEESWYVNSKGLPYMLIAGDYDSAGVRATSGSEVTDIGSDEFNTTAALPGRQLCAGGSNTIYALQQGTAYQWQVDTGTGFMNINDNMNYAGSATPALQLVQIPSAWYGYRYRCVIDGVSDPEITIVFTNSWRGTINNDWSEPGNWSCGIVPDDHTDVQIYSGNPVLNSNTVIRSLQLAAGVNLTITTGIVLTVLH